MATKQFFAAVGNGETIALIGPAARIEWLCVPRVDSFPVFASALDPERGGYLALLVNGQELIPAGHRYRGRSNIAETMGAAGDLSVLVQDYMPWGQHHVVREITVTNTGATTTPVDLGVKVEGTHSRHAPEHLADRVRAAFRGMTSGSLAPGESLRTTMLLTYADDPAAPDWSLAQEEQFWADWLAGAKPVSTTPDLEEAYWRSLLALKLLCQEQSGAVLAAATASFPAIPGGGDNWDYRYCWLRDGYFIARALDQAGLHAESRRFYEFAMRQQHPDGRWYQTLYTVDGGNPKEFIVDDLRGPGGETPIRFGNAASDQLQIDSEANILHGLACHWQATGDTAWLAQHWDSIHRAADQVMTTWKLKENGIWEIRERVDHWIYGKALCAAALRASATMAGALGHEEASARWRAEADTITADVVAHGWSEARQAYLQTYDDRSPVDISALALSLWDILPADDARLAATVALMEQPLRRPALPEGMEYSTDTPFWGIQAGGLNMRGAMARYDYAAVPFYLPTLWLARHYLRAGKRERAMELLRLCLASATELGLMAEHFDPATGGQWGNFPQAFSHLEVVMTVLELQG